MRRTGVLVVLVVLLAGCTFRIGAPTSESSWSKQADQVLGSAMSSLGTARLVLEHERELPHPYAVVTMQDAVTGLSKESRTFLTTQPPDDRHREYQQVVAALGAATVVLTRVGAEVATPGSDAALVRQVRSAYDAIDRLRTQVAGS